MFNPDQNFETPNRGKPTNNNRQHRSKTKTRKKYLEQIATRQCPHGEGQSLSPQRQTQPCKSRRASEPAASSSVAAGSSLSCCWQWFLSAIHKSLFLFYQPRSSQSPFKPTPPKKSSTFLNNTIMQCPNNPSDSNSPNGHPKKPLKNAKQRYPIARGTRTEKTGEEGIVISDKVKKKILIITMWYRGRVCVFFVLFLLVLCWY